MSPMIPRVASRDTVVLVHGMLATRHSMAPIADRLQSRGLDVINWCYPTLKHSLRHHADVLSTVIGERLKRPETRRVDFVGHSMGCIIIRLAIQTCPIRRATRFVMLAPPNRGARLTRWSVSPLDRWFPPLGELSIRDDSLVNRLDEPVGVKVGIIAADRDRVVDLASTRLRMPCEHLVVRSTHQRLPSNDWAIRHIDRFLSEGTFEAATTIQRAA